MAYLKRILHVCEQYNQGSLSKTLIFQVQLNYQYFKVPIKNSLPSQYFGFRHAFSMESTRITKLEN